MFGHRDITNVLLDHETFSNEVSGRLSVPNGINPPHTRRTAALLSRSFPGVPGTFRGLARAIAAELIDGAMAGT